MKSNTSIHPLARANVKSGKIRFKNRESGKEYTYYTCVNDLTGDRMDWIDNGPPYLHASGGYLKSMFKNIREGCDVLEVVGDY